MNLRDYVRQADPAAFPFRQVIEARNSDVDRLGHVNNAAMIDLFSEARFRFLRRIAPSETRVSGFHFVVGQQGAIYVGDTLVERPIEIGCGVIGISRSTVRFTHVLFNGGQPTAAAEAVIVHTVQGRAQPIFPEVAAMFEQYLLPAGSVPRLLAE